MSDNPKIVLCLSGGGFRATFFHLGTVRWLVEHGLANRIEAVYSVSGGSILAAHLAKSWLQGLASTNNTQDNLSKFDFASDQLVSFGWSDVRGRVVRRWLLWNMCIGWTAYLSLMYRLVESWGTRFQMTQLLEREYGRLLTHNWSLGTLRGQNAPKFNLLATSLPTGELCVMSQNGIRRINPHSNEGLAPKEMKMRPPAASLMVAASSAFPPLFPPVTLTSDLLGGESIETMGVDPLHLTDGGIYDNIGIGLATRDAKDSGQVVRPLFIVSDASASFDWVGNSSFTDPLSRTVRTTDILMKRVAEFEDSLSKRYAGEMVVCVRIDSQVNNQRMPGTLDLNVQSQLRRLRTDLDRFSHAEMGALAAHGHEVAHQVLAAQFSVQWKGPWYPPSTQTAMHQPSAKIEKLIRNGARRRLFHWVLSDWTIYAFGLLLLAALAAIWMAGGALWNQRADQVKIVQAAQEKDRRIDALQTLNAKLVNEVNEREAAIERMKKTSSATLEVIPAVTPLAQRRVIAKSSDNLPSGLGRAFSDIYTLCSDPLHESEIIVASEFRLSGDRSCGAWSECKNTVNTPTQVCWQFRLQGHDEWFPPRPSYSTGILSVTVEKASK